MCLADEISRCKQRITPAFGIGRAGMTGLASKDDLVGGAPDNRADDADLRLLLVKLCPLLDVEFDVTGVLFRGALCAVHFCRVDASAQQRGAKHRFLARLIVIIFQWG